MKKKKCAKCGCNNDLTIHHIFPRCWFKGYGLKIVLCRSCHDRIEALIPKFQKFSKKWYIEQNNHWLQGGV